MARTNDNWERLVASVLRKEKLWQMFHAPSRTPSMSSIASGTSFSYSVAVPFLDMVTSDEKFESRRHLEDEILETLMRSDIKTIGIFGAGGIGKTTMAKRIGDMVKRGKLFDEVIMTGHQPDFEKIYSDITEVLSNSTLLILDDVWVSFILEYVRIPKRCKIILISQNLEVFEAMQVERVFQVQILTDDEAWILLKLSVGKKAEDPDLQLIGMVLAKECKGVPLALVIIGFALKEKDKPFWENALLQFRISAPSNILKVPLHVYHSLKISYMSLSDEAKFLFLICCLFKEDSDIFLEELVRFGIGLNTFGGFTSLEDARNRVHALATKLKNRSLLEDGHDPVLNVKMHVVTRNVAISIASEGREVYMVNHDARLINWAEKKSLELCTNISLISTETIELSEGLLCPNVQFLRLQCKTLKVPNNFFDGLRGLSVLVLKDICIDALPPSLHLMTHLRSLHLHSCNVKSISVVGHLANLEILSCLNCHEIEVLPAEIGRLNHLRLLELYKCRRLKNIVPSVISSLFLLEELIIRESFDQWEPPGLGRTNASLSELQSLSNLINLEIEVQDPIVVATIIHPFPDVTKFCIIVGADDKTSHQIKVPTPYKITEGENYMQLSLPKETNPGNWICYLLKRTEYLNLVGNGSTNLIFEEFELVKKFRFYHCSTVNHLLDKPSKCVFPVLELLDLKDLPNLQVVSHSPIPVGSFWNLRDLKLQNLPALLNLWKNPDQPDFLMNLKSVDIRNCKKLPYLFTTSIVRSFVQLEELRILFCGMMKEVFWNDGYEVTGSIAFPKLKKLILHFLPSLVAFWKEFEIIKFPQLYFLSIRNLPKLRGFLPAYSSLPFFIDQMVEFDDLKELSLNELGDSISQIWSLQTPISYFSKLEKLRIVSCNKLKNLFSPLIVKDLWNLKELEIRDCLMMAEVIVNVEKETERHLFPSLERLDLWRLQSLRSFCQWKQDLEFPSLRHVKICLCHELKTFTLGSVGTPVLEYFEIDSEQIETKDVNEIIQHHFRAKDKHGGITSTAHFR